MSGALLWVVNPKENAASLLSLMPRIGTLKRSKLYSRVSFTCGNIVAYSAGGAVAHPASSSEENVYEVVLKQAALVREQRRVPKERRSSKGLEFGEGLEESEGLMNEAYDRCGEVCAEYAKTFYLGTLLMTPERRRAVWAIYSSSNCSSSRCIFILT